MGGLVDRCIYRNQLGATMYGLSALPFQTMSKYRHMAPKALYSPKPPKYPGQYGRFRVGAWAGDGVEPTFTRRSFKITPDEPEQLTNKLSRQHLRYQLRQSRNRVRKAERADG